MADLSITESQVIIGSGSFETLVAGEALAVGEGYYLKSADGKAWRAVNSSAAAAAMRGICVAAAEAADQKMVGQKTLSVTLGAGAAPAVGTPYFVSSNAGKLCPIGDVTTGMYVTRAGFGDAANALNMGSGPWATGIAHA